MTDHSFWIQKQKVNVVITTVFNFNIPKEIHKLIQKFWQAKKCPPPPRDATCLCTHLVYTT